MLSKKKKILYVKEKQNYLVNDPVSPLFQIINGHDISKSL